MRRIICVLHDVQDSYDIGEVDSGNLTNAYIRPVLSIAFPPMHFRQQEPNACSDTKFCLFADGVFRILIRGREQFMPSNLSYVC